MMSIECTFWGVGQGLFSSGQIKSGGNSIFNWVYDCGSVKKTRKDLLESITKMKSNCGDKIDFLMLSHFDEDHISGVVELSKGKKIDKLILPYFPLWQRLVIALELGIKSDSTQFSFYLDPVKYILEHCGQALADGKVYLLPATEDVTFPLKLKEANLEIQDISSLKDVIDKNSVILLPKGWSISSNKIEFIPYNAPLSLLKKSPTDWDLFYQKVENALPQDQISQQNIDNLKNIYDSEFVRMGKGKKEKGRDRNMISAFLYIGHCNNKFDCLSDVKRFHQPSLYENCHYYRGFTKVCCLNSSIDESRDRFYLKNLDVNAPKRTGILYTGDGFLSTPEQFDHLKLALGDRRINSIFCLQVPHHGSRYNWFLGLADKIKPCVSIFSAEPTYANYNHPHKEVVKDFLPYSPMLVNQNAYVKFGIMYLYPPFTGNEENK